MANQQIENFTSAMNTLRQKPLSNATSPEGLRSIGLAEYTKLRDDLLNEFNKIKQDMVTFYTNHQTLSPEDAITWEQLVEGMKALKLEFSEKLPDPESLKTPKAYSLKGDTHTTWLGTTPVSADEIGKMEILRYFGYSGNIEYYIVMVNNKRHILRIDRGGFSFNRRYGSNIIGLLEIGESDDDSIIRSSIALKDFPPLRITDRSYLGPVIYHPTLKDDLDSAGILHKLENVKTFVTP